MNLTLQDRYLDSIESRKLGMSIHIDKPVAPNSVT